MKKSSNNLNKILLNNNRVNNYTKLLIKLYALDYYEDYYIPNKKLMRMLNINKNRVIVLLEQLKEDNIIRIVYKGRKRYFVFIGDIKEKKKEERNDYNDMFDYNWLEED